MRYLYLLIICMLSACSDCDIPYGEYKSLGGTESMTTLVLNPASYALKFESWKPAGYEKRSIINEQGSWVCNSRLVEIKTENGVAIAEIKEIGVNPLGLAITTKALVFKESANEILSNETLYPSDSLKDVE